MRPLLSILVACLVTATAAPVLAADACKEDGDCSGVLLCRENRCVPVQCRADQDCPAGSMCRDELCRIRQCYSDLDCPIDRECDGGSCVIPPPPQPMKDPVVPGVVRILAGPVFPLGLQVHADLPLGDNRWVMAGLGTTANSGGVTWRVGMRGAPVKLDAFRVDAWAAAMGFNLGNETSAPEEGEKKAAPPPEALPIILGSGRFLFEEGRGIQAMWWGAGAGVSVPHGDKNGRILRMEIGLLVLADDRYPPERDFALLPMFGLQYGWSLDFTDSKPKQYRGFNRRAF